MKKAREFWINQTTEGMEPFFRARNDDHSMCGWLHCREVLPDEQSKIEVLEQELEKLKFNYDLRTKEYDDFKASLPETHWGYWRKRAGEMTSAWYDRGVEIELLEAKNKELEAKLSLAEDLITHPYWVTRESEISPSLMMRRKNLITALYEEESKNEND